MIIDSSFSFRSHEDSFPAFLILPAAAKYQAPISILLH